MLGLSYNTALVLAGVALLGGAAGVIGCFAVLKRRSLTGDALAHAALPGLCLAYFVAGERDFHSLLLGAFVSGLVGIASMSALRRWTRLKEDAAIAIVLSVFFGLGVVLLSIISRIPGGHRAGLESFILGKTAGMKQSDLELIVILALGTMAVVLLLYKEFKLVTFDLAFAQVQGWPGQLLDWLLQLLLVVAVIVGLPAVGVVLMAALLVIPGAAARFWTDRLGITLLLSGSFGMVAGIVGALTSAEFDRIPAGPTVILAAAVIFVVSLFFGFRRGILERIFERRRFRETFHRARLLEILHPFENGASLGEVIRESGWTPALASGRIALGRQEGWIEPTTNLSPSNNDVIRLTPLGMQRAAEVVATKQRWKEALLERPQETPTLLRLDIDSTD